jgi:NAD+ diphosphatase
MSAVNGQVSKMDRAGHLRTNQTTLDQMWQRAKIIHVADARLAVEAGGTKLRFLTSDEVASLISSKAFKSGERYFLGLDELDQDPYFAWNASSVEPQGENAPDGYLTLREIGGLISEFEMEISLHAIALANWHKSHTHCARCGAPTSSAQGGAIRTCDKDKSEHYPRTDSAVIVLVRDKDDRILLGHQPIWPEGRFSCFAGFLEPGETFEQCVQREVLEESGVLVREISYLGSQPWPFPASIMISFDAVTDAPDIARPDGQEITEVKWFSRAEVKAQSDAGTLLLPPTMSVARKMIDRWFAQGAEGQDKDGNGGAKLLGGETWR